MSNSTTQQAGVAGLHHPAVAGLDAVAVQLCLSAGLDPVAAAALMRRVAAAAGPWSPVEKSLVDVARTALLYAEDTGNDLLAARARAALETAGVNSVPGAE